MGQVSVQIPQIGEGLQEARLVAFLKQPGDLVRRDEPIYQMETDKAVMDVESPVEGRLVRWLVQPDDIVAIGADVAVMEVASATVDSPAEPVPAPVSTDSTVELIIPQIGEGLQEARLVAFLKQPGDLVRRDEPIYQMETDKAVMDVESPYEGTLVEWLAAPDDVLAIGATVGRIRAAGAVEAMAAPVHGPAATVEVPAPSAPAAASLRNANIPPRTRAYAKERGVSEDTLLTITASGSKLMPEDVDAFLSVHAAKAPRSAGYTENALSPKQRLLASRLVRGNQVVVPGTITVATNWEPMERQRAQIKASGDAFQPSAFTMFAYAVTQAMKDHPSFRSSLVGDATLRTYEHVQLGIAVALPGDELVIAVVDDADTLSWPEFAQRTREKIELARTGKDQANEAVTLSLTNMQAFGLREAVPVVVPPSVATVFLGEVYNGLANDTTELRLQRSVNLVLTFDHRVINGVGAADFLNAIRKNVESIGDLLAK